MSAADEAYAKAVERIAWAKAEGWGNLNFNTEDFGALAAIPPQITDLPKLRTLDLGNTQISDPGPLSGLARLGFLSLNQTSVRDLGPLSGLARLGFLSLNHTAVIDLAPLSGLTELKRLSLRHTAVSDLAPLNGLTGLKELNLNQTAVSNLAPLSGLTGLKELDLRQTAVSDLAPLSGLTGLKELDLNQTAVSDLAPLSGLTGLKWLYLDQTAVSDLAPLSGMTRLEWLDLDKTAVSDLRPLTGLTRLVEQPSLSGLTFRNCTACEIDPEIAEISEIENASERARRLFAYLKDRVPPATMKARQNGGVSVFEAARDLDTQFKKIGGLQPARFSGPPSGDFVDSRRPTHTPVASPISVAQIQQVMRDSYPDLRDRATRLVDLIQQERAAHAMILRPNDPETLRAYEVKEEFLKTLEAGLVTLHEDLPEAAPEVIPEEKAKALREKLMYLAGLLDNTIKYLDEDKGTYGGLYKIGLISGVASLLALVPGVTFVTGAALPSLVFGVQTFRVVVGRDDKG